MVAVWGDNPLHAPPSPLFSHHGSRSPHLAKTPKGCRPPPLPQVEDPTKYGVVVMDEYGLVQRFVEKPKVGRAL